MGPGPLRALSARPALVAGSATSRDMRVCGMAAVGMVLMVGDVAYGEAEVRYDDGGVLACCSVLAG
jgi:hypothetical protein